MTKAIVAGDDVDGLGAALEAEGVETTSIDTPATADSMEAAGLADADLFVLTDLADATAIPLAKELNPDVRVVVYAHDTLPEFAKGQADLAVDPDLLGPEVVAEELVA
jgi:voltage-gated potassium channel Kch